MGKDRENYAIAEISNAKSSNDTLSSAAFKYALGVDTKMGDMGWLEFRIGRARTVDGTKDETKALFGFKVSPPTTGSKLSQGL
jgi:hypothetical protein